MGLEHLEAFLLGWKRLSPAFAAAQTVVFVGVTLGIALVVRLATVHVACAVLPLSNGDGP